MIHVILKMLGTERLVSTGISNGAFSFSPQLKKNWSSTEKGISWTVSSNFDTLEFASPFILSAKVFL